MEKVSTAVPAAETGRGEAEKAADAISATGAVNAGELTIGFAGSCLSDLFRVLRGLHPQVPYQERPLVRGFFDLL